METFAVVLRWIQVISIMATAFCIGMAIYHSLRASKLLKEAARQYEISREGIGGA